MPTSPTQIDYAQCLPWHRQRRWQRWLFSILTISLLAFGGYMWGPSLWRHAQLLYWQHRCVTFQQDKGTIVADLTNNVFHPAKPWLAFCSTYSPPGIVSDGTIFVGTMQNRSGEERLVGVDVVCSGAILSTRVFALGSLFRSPKELTSHVSVGGPIANITGRDDGTIQAAELVTAEGSQSFTFTATTVEGTWQAQGWLRDDNYVDVEWHRVENEPSSITVPPPAPRK